MWELEGGCGWTGSARVKGGHNPLAPLIEDSKVSFGGCLPQGEGFGRRVEVHKSEWQDRVDTHDPGVELGPQARVLGPKDVDDAAQAEVDAGGQEGRADGEGADLDEEVVFLPGGQYQHLILVVRAQGSECTVVKPQQPGQTS